MYRRHCVTPASTPMPSPELKTELYPYQQDGVRFSLFKRAVLIGDEMGLGKTLQALCAVHGRTLVVAPTSVLHNW